AGAPQTPARGQNPRAGCRCWPHIPSPARASPGCPSPAPSSPRRLGATWEIDRGQRSAKPPPSPPPRPAPTSGGCRHSPPWRSPRAAEAGDESEKGDAVVQAASGRLDDCVRRILRRPVRGLADIRLLAEALHWRLWTDPAGITEKNHLERVKSG